MPKLSKTMKKLLTLLNAGKSNAQIAVELDIREHTVKVHCWRLFKRIGVASRLEAAKWWRDHQPESAAHALHAAFDAACRYFDTQGVVCPEFEYHRAHVNKLLKGAAQ